MALSLGRYDDTIAELSPLAQQGAAPTPGVLLWLSDLVEALALSGRADEARGYLDDRSEEHTSELQSLMRNSYAVYCLKKKNNTTNTINTKTLRHTHEHKYKY